MKNYLNKNRAETIKSEKIKIQNSGKLSFSKYRNAIVAPTIAHNNASGGVFDYNGNIVKKSVRTNSWLARGGITLLI